VADHLTALGYLSEGPSIKFLTGEIPGIFEAVVLCLNSDHAPPPVFTIACVVWVGGMEKRMASLGEDLRPDFIDEIIHASEAALMHYPPEYWSDKEVVDCMASECAEVRHSCLVFLQYRQTA